MGRHSWPNRGIHASSKTVSFEKKNTAMSPTARSSLATLAGYFAPPAGFRTFCSRPPVLRHSREATLLCSPKLAQHHSQLGGVLTLGNSVLLPHGLALIGAPAHVVLLLATRTRYAPSARMTRNQPHAFGVDDVACQISCPAPTPVPPPSKNKAIPGLGGPAACEGVRPISRPAPTKHLLMDRMRSDNLLWNLKWI